MDEQGERRTPPHGARGAASAPTLERAAGTAVAAGAFGLYLLTLAPGLTWANHGADGGDLIAASVTGGVPHPTGYPTYVLLGRLWAAVLRGDVARRYNLLSAAAAAATALIVYHAVRRLLRHESPALRAAVAAGAALATAAGRTLWSQAVIAEVYAPAALVLATCLYLALRDDLTDRRGYWVGLGALWGAGLGVHLTVALAAPGLLVLLWPRLRRARLGALAAGVAMGLATFAYLPLAARAGPPVNWGNPRSWEGFWWLVSGRLYHGYAFSLPWEELGGRLSAWAALWGTQWGWHGLLLGLVGLPSLWAVRRRVALAVVAIAATYGVYAVGYHTPDSFVYLIPAFVAFALPMAWGAAALWAWWAGSAVRARGRPAAMVGTAALLLVPMWAVSANYPAADASGAHEAREWLGRVSAAAPEGALVISGDDRHTFALSYLQWVEGRRRDLVVVDGELWPHAWYAEQIRGRWPGMEPPPPGVTLEALAALTLERRPVLLTAPREGWPLEPSGDLWRLLPPGPSAGNKP